MKRWRQGIWPSLASWMLPTIPYITDLSGLEYLANLTSFSLQYNQISDIAPLANSTSLASLVLYDNRISDIAPLANLTGLTTRDIDHHFAGGAVHVRKLGRHYHPDPGCGFLRSPPADDPYFTTSFHLDELGRPDPRNSGGHPYYPCRCAVRVMRRGG